MEELQDAEGDSEAAEMCVTENMQRCDLTPLEEAQGVKALLDDVNIEDKGCTERVYRGLLAGMSAPGPLSHLERPNFEFAQYIASRIPA